MASSSPFELCEITDIVQIEAPPNSEKSDDSKKAFKTEPKHVEKETKFVWSKLQDKIDRDTVSGGWIQE